jgi:hypothetical protein
LCRCSSLQRYPCNMASMKIAIVNVSVMIVSPQHRKTLVLLGSSAQ